MAGNSINISVLADVRNAVAGIQETNDHLGKLNGIAGKAMGAVKGLAAGFVAFQAVDVIVDKFKEANQAVQEQQTLLAQTNAVLKSTGGAAGVSASGIVDLSNALEAKSMIDAEQIQSGENLLLTFTNVKNAAGAGNDIFNQTTQIMTDMSTAMGQDTKTSAIQLGKALNDPIAGVGALSKVGVSFTDQQKEQIKTLQESGDTMGAQKIILGELSKEFGGSAAAASDTFAGKMYHLKNTIDGAFETIVQKAMPVLANLAGFISDKVIPAAGQLATWLGDNVVPKLKELGESISANVLPVLQNLGNFIIGTVIPALVSLGGFIAEHKTLFESLAVGIGAVYLAFKTYQAGMAIWKAATEAYTAVQVALNLAMDANPIGILVLALTGLVAGLIFAYQNSETFRDIVNGVWNAIKGTVMGVLNWFTGTLWPGIQAVWTGIGNAIQAAANFISNLFLKWTLPGILISHWSEIKDTVTAVWNGITGFFSGIPGRITGFFSGIAGFFSGVWNSVRNFAVDQFGGMVSFVSGIPGRITGAFGSIGGFFSGLWSNVRSGAVNGFNELVSVVAGIPGRITGALGGLGGLLVNAGESVIRGFINGIQNMIGSVKSTLGDLTSKLTSWKGPESLDKVILKNAGQLVIKGFINGLESQYGNVRSSLGGLTNSLSASATPQVALGGYAGGRSTTVVYNVNVDAMVADHNAGRRVVEALEAHRAMGGVV